METNCVICGEPVDDANSVSCNWCGQAFHLALREDSPVSDCGRIYCGQEFLMFICDACVKKHQIPEELLSPRKP